MDHALPLALAGELLSPWVDGPRAELLRDRVRQGRVEWEPLVALAGAYLLTPALWPALAAKGVLDELENDLREYLTVVHELNTLRNIQLAEQAAEIATALNGIASEPVFLKGAALLLRGLYQDPAARFIGDIDMLVDRSDLRAAADILAVLGYERLLGWSDDSHHPVVMVHSDRPALVELHQRLLPLSLAGLLPEREVVREAVRLDLGPARAWMPHPTHLVMHNIVHAMLHHRYYALAELPLRDAFDLILIADRFGESVDWSAVERRFVESRHGIGSLAFYLIAAKEVFRDARLPPIVPSPDARITLWRWRRRKGRLPSPYLHGAIRLRAHFEDTFRRLRHGPGERRRMFRRLLTPGWYPRYLVGLARIARHQPSPASLASSRAAPDRPKVLSSD